MKLFMLAACGALSACSLLSPKDVPSTAETPSRTLQVNGEAFVISQITASTWIAVAPSRSSSLPASADSTAALRRAIENVSGCAVTDSDYSRQGRQFDAQVDCDQRPRK